MQELSVTNANLPDLLAVVARGESVRLLEGGREVAVLSPPQGSPASEDSEAAGGEPIDRSPGWIMRIRDKYELDKHGFTKEEIDALRDRSPGPDPISFE